MRKYLELEPSCAEALRLLKEIRKDIQGKGSLMAGIFAKSKGSDMSSSNVCRPRECCRVCYPSFVKIMSEEQMPCVDGINIPLMIGVSVRVCGIEGPSPSAPEVTPSTLNQGDYAVYSRTEETETVQILEVHFEDVTPFYTIKMQDGREKQVESQHLTPSPSSAFSPASASAPGSASPSAPLIELNDQIGTVCGWDEKCRRVCVQVSGKEYPIENKNLRLATSLQNYYGAVCSPLEVEGACAEDTLADSRCHKKEDEFMLVTVHTEGAEQPRVFNVYVSKKELVAANDLPQKQKDVLAVCAHIGHRFRHGRYVLGKTGEDCGVAFGWVEESFLGVKVMHTTRQSSTASVADFKPLFCNQIAKLTTKDQADVMAAMEELGQNQVEELGQNQVANLTGRPQVDDTQTDARCEPQDVDRSVSAVNYWKQIFSDFSDKINGDEFCLMEEIFTAACQTKGYPKIRHTQKLAVIQGFWHYKCKIHEDTGCLVQSQGDNLLLEMKTGEGKTCVLAMLAALIFKSSNGNEKVDIFTTSPVLAQEGHQEWALFYEKLKISSDFTSDGGDDEQRAKPYKADVLYTTIFTTSADLLRTEVMGQNIRKRDVHVAFIDEIDMVLLDQAMNGVHIESGTTGMWHLDPLLALIWGLVATKVCVCIDGESEPGWTDCNPGLDDIPNTKEAADIPEPSKLKDGKTQLWELGECIHDGNTFTVAQTTRKVHLNQQNIHHMLWDDESKMYRPFYTSLQELRKSIIDTVKSTITFDKEAENENEDPAASVILHPDFSDYVDKVLPTLVASAMRAKTSDLGVTYKLSERTGNLQLLDSGTGLTQDNTKWSDGAQSFIQLKHAMAVSSMSLGNNFMSTAGLMEQYTYIFGLTGTKGGEHEEKAFAEYYSLIPKVIPPFTPSKLKVLPHELCDNEQQWQHKIHSLCDPARATLVLCQNPLRAESLIDFFHKRNKFKVVQCISSDRGDPERLQQDTLFPRTVVIATNLASRGTDITLSESVKDAGGLEVVVSFWLENNRQKWQAFGRAARQGQPGSAVVVCCSQHILEEKGYDLISAARSHVQSGDLAAIENYCFEHQEKVHMGHLANSLQSDKKRAEIFKTFCDFRRQPPDGTSERRELEDCEDDPLDLVLKETYGRWLADMSLSGSSLTFEGGKLCDGKGSQECDFERRSVQDLKRDLIDKLTDVKEKPKRHSALHKVHVAVHRAKKRPGKKAKLIPIAKSTELLKEAKLLAPAFDLVPNYILARNCFLEDRKGGDEYEKKKVEGNEQLEQAKQFLQKAIESIGPMVLGFSVVHSVSQLCVQMETKANVTMSEEQAEGDKSARCCTAEDQLSIRLEVLESLKKKIQGNIDIIDEAIKGEDPVKIDQWESLELLASPDQDGGGNECTKELDGTAKGMRDAVLHDLRNIGLTRTFKLKACRSIWGPLGCLFIGLGQIIAGAALLIFSVGTCTTFATGLICEGVSDAISGIKGMVNGQFSWTEWAVGKAVSFVISLACAGLGRIKDAVKESMGIVKEVTKDALQEVVKEGAKGGVKEVRKETMKVIVKEFATQGALEGLGAATSMVVDVAVQAPYENIQVSKFKSDLRTKLGKIAMHPNAMHADEARPLNVVDCHPDLISSLKNIVQNFEVELMQNEAIQSSLATQAESIAKRIGNGMGGKTARFTKVIDVTQNVAEAISGLKDASELMDGFIKVAARDFGNFFKEELHGIKWAADKVHEMLVSKRATRGQMESWCKHYRSRSLMKVTWEQSMPPELRACIQELQEELTCQEQYANNVVGNWLLWESLVLTCTESF